MARFAVLLSAVVLLVAFTPATKAASVQWSVADGGNGHFYEAFSVPDGISWTSASQIADLMGGYLVTITSQAENDFVYDLINYDMYWDGPSGPWIGGYQPPGSPEPAGGWTWVTDEPFIYSNWNDQQPNSTRLPHLLGTAAFFPLGAGGVFAFLARPPARGFGLETSGVGSTGSSRACHSANSRR